MNWLQNKDERVIFYSSVFVKLFFVVVVVALGGWFQSFDSIQSDGYLPLAVNLYQHQAFSYATSSPYAPEALQVPGYPLFLAILAAPFMNVIPALLVQVLLMSFSALFLYKLTEGYFSQRVRFWGAFIYAVEPFASFMAASALTEASFMFLFLGGLYALRLAYDTNKTSLWILAGLVLGTSVLVRPIDMYLVPLLIIGAGFIAWRREKVLKGVLLALLFFALLPGAWVARNYAQFGVATLATKAPFTLYFYNVEQLLEYKNHITAAEAEVLLVSEAKAVYPEIDTKDNLRHPKYASYLNKKSFEYIKANVPLYAKLQLLSLGTFFLSDGYRLLLQSLNVPIAPLPNITKAVAGGQWGVLIEYFVQNPISLGVFVVGAGIWALATLFAVSSLAIAWYGGNKKVLLGVLIFALIVAYFAVLTGPVAQARYRVVVEPFLFVLAVYSISQLRMWYKRRT